MVRRCCRVAGRPPGRDRRQPGRERPDAPLLTREQRPASTAILGAAPRERSGVEAGVMSTVAGMGMVVGFGLVGAVFTVVLGRPASEQILQRLAAAADTTSRRLFSPSWRQVRSCASCRVNGQRSPEYRQSRRAVRAEREVLLRPGQLRSASQRHRVGRPRRPGLIANYRALPLPAGTRQVRVDDGRGGIQLPQWPVTEGRTLAVSSHCR